jgi:hypothetical protein
LIQQQINSKLNTSVLDLKEIMRIRKKRADEFCHSRKRDDFLNKSSGFFKQDMDRMMMNRSKESISKFNTRNSTYRDSSTQDLSLPKSNLSSVDKLKIRISKLKKDEKVSQRKTDELNKALIDSNNNHLSKMD